MEQLHRRGLYILHLDAQHITIAGFDYANTLTAPRIMSWALDAYWWVRSLLPDHRIAFIIFTLDVAGRDALTRQMSAPLPGGLTYAKSRAEAQHVLGCGWHVCVRDQDITCRWCGGVRSIS